MATCLASENPVLVLDAGHVDGVAHRPNGLLADLVARGGEVAEVERMTDDAADARLASLDPESLDRLRLVIGRAPHPRALGEHLRAVAAHGRDPVDCGVDPAAGGDVRAEFHRVPTIEPKCPSASAWPRAQQASCTSVMP